ncbi:MAG: Double zinc ribbon [Actinomycetota bacterium]|jgi:hypothetical protein|nr:Double zinc ribbon [Actinomycetota bacterium]
MEGFPSQTPASKDDVRCTSCGALVTPDAEWCGQCFTPLKSTPVSREELAATVGIKIREELPREGTGPVPTSGPKPHLTWPCPACEHENDIELSLCEVCGTPFAALMKADETPVRVEPKEALTWSLVYPGLGHGKAGRGADGVARGTLFTLSWILLLVVALAGFGSVGQDVMAGFYLITTLTVYLGSAAEAYRIAQGRGTLVSSRALLWGTVGLLLVSIGLLAIAATFARR